MQVQQHFHSHDLFALQSIDSTKFLHWSESREKWKSLWIGIVLFQFLRNFFFSLVFFDANASVVSSRDCLIVVESTSQCVPYFSIAVCSVFWFLNIFFFLFLSYGWKEIVQRSMINALDGKKKEKKRNKNRNAENVEASNCELCAQQLNSQNAGWGESERRNVK